MTTQMTILMFITITALSQSAFGYKYRTCGQNDVIEWKGGAPEFLAHDGGFPANHFRRNALREVVERWNNSPANFRFNLKWNEPSVARDNGQNEIWFTEDTDVMDGYPAYTFHADDCIEGGDANSHIVEKDIVFACDKVWTRCRAEYLSEYSRPIAWYFGSNRAEILGYGGGQRYFQATAMHELGHALGLKHEDSEYNLMGISQTHLHAYGNAATAYPGEDASDGAVRLYGASPVAREDLGVVHWQQPDPACATNDGYSKHNRTRILDTDNIELPVVGLAQGEFCERSNIVLPDYQVNAGQRIQVDFNFENNGTNIQSPLVYYYLSRDTIINGGDIFLADVHPTVARNSVYTRRQTVTLPSNLNAGDTYYILVVVDPWGTIAEVNETNNKTFSRRFVVQ